MDMEKIKVGEYIRTKDGYIGKCQKIDVYYGDILIRTELKRVIYDFEVAKHSFNIIDLIEEGDFVNDKKVKINYKDAILFEDGSEIVEQQIKSIVTKEQFKAMEYEVK